MEQLKQCPFCGGQASIGLSLVAGRDGSPIHLFFASCDKCHSRSGFRRSKKEAIAAWNTSAERTCKNLYLHATSPRFWCSDCDFKSNWPASNGKATKPNYCPNCGARVVGD